MWKFEVVSESAARTASWKTKRPKSRGATPPELDCGGCASSQLDPNFVFLRNLGGCASFDSLVNSRTPSTSSGESKGNLEGCLAWHCWVGFCSNAVLPGVASWCNLEFQVRCMQIIYQSHCKDIVPAPPQRGEGGTMTNSSPLSSPREPWNIYTY